MFIIETVCVCVYGCVWGGGEERERERERDRERDRERGRERKSHSVKYYDILLNYFVHDDIHLYV